ncbi:6-phosphogluconolactonase [Leptothoe kymatousa]|uniref:6-phosphogluconolactonase n=1 Tax=Leptothoe kymatousa TAU-MAC 1615 TaxID=2364775 RepID=A0ABS5Y725_9CYAN|nr:6-phosphogluconolactonase [Leptothoe kymatousa]MBT9313628.1 6-phosphogluconolactonase [Leptothoe kymatousa TAU-MAC 1615]
MRTIQTPTVCRIKQVDNLQVQICLDPDMLAQAAAQQIIAQLTHTLQQQATATVVFATGRSQLGLLNYLRQDRTVDWSRVVGLHLDEFLGLPSEHPASFGYYLRQHIAQWLPFKAFHYLHGDALEPMAECDRYTRLLTQAPIDLCLLGVGNNGHLAFNDPAVANFNDPRWVKLVRLDHPNRQQQLTSEHFEQLQDVPTHALTLTLSAISSARHTLCCVFGQSKAAILHQLLTMVPAATCPASMLRLGGHHRLLTDEATYQLAQKAASLEEKHFPH